MKNALWIAHYVFKVFYRQIILFLLLFTFFNAYSQTNVGGVISSNETWTKANSPYVVTNPVLVNEGITLIIEAGVYVQIQEDNYIRVDGELIAEGTAEDSIIFNPTSKGIHFEGTAVDYDSITNTGCRIKFAKFLNYSSGSDNPYYHSGVLSNSWEFVGPNSNGQISLLISNCYFETFNMTLRGQGGKDIPEKTYFEENILKNGVFRVIGDDFGDKGSNTAVRKCKYINVSVADFLNNDFEYNLFDNCEISFIHSGSDRYSIHHNYINTQIDIGYRWEFHDNTLVCTEGDNITADHIFLFQNNNIVGSTDYKYRYTGTTSYNIINNYWGTSSLQEVRDAIYDFDEDFNLGVVNVDPILTSPVEDAPAFIHQVQFSPDDTITTNELTLTLTFSKPMDVGNPPIVTFGTTEPYDGYTFGAGNWTNSNKTYTLNYSDIGSIPSGSVFHIKVSEAKGVDDYYAIPATVLTQTFIKNTPATIQSLEIIPNDTINNDPFTVVVNFDKQMDNNYAPTITFGDSSPFNQYSFSNGGWSNGETKYTADYSDVLDLPTAESFTVKIVGAKGLGDQEAMSEQLFSNAFIRLLPVEINNVDFLPNDTIDNEEITISISFSKTMDTNFTPILTFGGIEPFNTYAFPSGDWSNGNTKYSSTFINTIGLPPFVPYNIVISNAKASEDNSPIQSMLLEKTFIRNVPYQDTVHVIVYDSIAVTDTLIIDVVLTSIDSPDNVNTLKIYPNPAKDHIYINTGDYTKMNGYQLKIINQTGAIVFETNVENQLYEVNLSTWTGTGMYYIQVLDSGGGIIEIRKIILQ